MIIRILATGETRKVSPAEAKRLIESKQAVPAVSRDRRIESRIEHR